MSHPPLHGYQTRAIDFTLANKAVFHMIDLGLGKTVIALKSMEQVGIPALVFSPIKVMYNTWPEEIRKWTPNLTYTILHGPRKDQRIRLKKDVYLINYEGIKWFFQTMMRARMKVNRMFAVFDESSMVTDASTVRFKLLKKLMPIFSPYRLCLTATPSPNGLHQLWTQMYLLDQGRALGTIYGRYRSRFFHYSGPPFYRTTIQAGAKHEIYRLIGSSVFRLDAKDYLKMPPLIVNPIHVKLPGKAREAYKEMEEKLAVTFDEEVVEAKTGLSAGSKLRQILQGALYTGSPKENPRPFRILHRAKLEMLKELLDSAAGQSLLCPIQFRFELQMVRDYLGYDVPFIAGGVNNKRATVLIKRWNNGDIPLLLCHPQSLARGLNLQQGGHNVVWLGIPWSLDHFEQLNGRLHRQGQTHTVTANMIVIEDSMDEVIVNVLQRKNRTQEDLKTAMKQYLMGA